MVLVPGRGSRWAISHFGADPPNGTSGPDSGYRAAFAALDADLPVLLLPVRLETTFQASGGSRRLVVRIYPDDVHLDTHDPGLRPGEVESGRAFWRAAWAGGGYRDDLGRFGRLADRIGAYRAAYVLAATRPVNWSARATGHMQPPQFPSPPPRDTVRPGRARLLPRQWVVAGYQSDAPLFVAAGAPVPDDLVSTPDFAAEGAAPRDIADLMRSQGLDWLHDLDAAESVGMAVRVDLPPSWRPAQGIDLYAVGVRDRDGADAVADLFESHRWTHGFDLVQRGTPTNNTDEGNSGVALSTPDLDPLLGPLLRPDTADPARARPGAVVPGPGGGSPAGPLARLRSGDALRAALGLPAGGALDAAPGASATQGRLARAMNAALWPATWGYMLRHPLSGAVPPDALDWLRQRFTDHVLPGGALPTLRVGRQPYGVLPVCAEPLTASSGQERALLDLLDALRPAWSDAVARVARLDPAAGGADAGRVPAGLAPGPADAADALADATAVLARVLGATPNPADLTVRTVTDESGLFASAWGVAVIMLGVILGPAPDAAGRLGAEIAGAATIEELIGVLSDAVHAGGFANGWLYLLAHTGDLAGPVATSAASAVDYINLLLLDGGIIRQDAPDGTDSAVTVAPLLANQLARVQPLLDLGPDRTAVTGLPGAAPALSGSLLAEQDQPWTAPIVADPGTDPAALGQWLSGLAAEVSGQDPAAGAPEGVPGLLYQMLRRSVDVAVDADRAALGDALDALARAATDGQLADPVAGLAVLTLETLGACGYRLDAWHTSAALIRLEELRGPRPTGLSVGGYGWVTGLRPRDGVPASQGYVHAPSLDHAATAAILRSGWSAFGGDATPAGTALAVDLSSARVRSATWIADGLRDGQRLADLLGQALERRLHDAALDRHVEPLRRLVLDATGQRRRQATAVVDGFAVARAWIGADQTAPLTSAEDAVRTALVPYVDDAGARLARVLDAHAGDLDAVADTGLAQAVHALVRADPAAASAAADGLSGGDAGPAALTVVRSARGGRRISHRVLLLLDAGDGAPAASGAPDAIAEPVLETWLDGILPWDAVRYGLWVTVAGERTWTGPFTLADAGLSRLLVLRCLPDPAVPVGGALADLLTWPVRRGYAAAGQLADVELDPDCVGAAPQAGTAGVAAPQAGDAGGVTLRLFLPSARGLRALLRGARPAGPSDLREAGATDPAAEVDAEALAELALREARLVDAARAAAQRLRDALDAPSADAGELLDAATLPDWAVGGGAEGLGAVATGDPADLAALGGRAERALAVMDARLAARDAVLGADTDAVLARIGFLLPGALVLPVFTAAGEDDLAASAGRSGVRLGGAPAALDWLHRVGRVRAAVGTAAVGVDLVEALSAYRFDPVLVQLPDYPAEGWAALTLPGPDAGPRTCLLTLAWAVGPRRSGLVVDGWTEVIPDRETTSGVAVHVDSPTARAPQAALLAVAARGRGWSYETVRDLVRQTLQRARERAAGPAEIEGFGQFLPAAYLGADVDPGSGAVTP